MEPLECACELLYNCCAKAKKKFLTSLMDIRYWYLSNILVFSPFSKPRDFYTGEIRSLRKEAN